MIPFVGETAGGANHNAFGWIFSTSSNDYVSKTLKQVTVTGNGPIAEDVFHNCRSIETFTATGKISSVGIFAFIDCESLKTVDFRGGVNEIRQSAFLKCRSLEEIFLSDTLTAIGKIVFEGCGEVTVVCSSGSEAYRYAEKNGIRVRLTGPAAEETAAPEETGIPTKTVPETDTRREDAESRTGSGNDRGGKESGIAAGIGYGMAIGIPIAAAAVFLLQVRMKKH